MSTGFSKKTFIRKEPGDISKKYNILKIIGQGGYARCLLVENKDTHQKYAMKELQKKKLSNLEAFAREVNIMRKLDHPNIIKLYEVYETNNYIYLVMELCDGGELFERIVSNTEKGKLFTEKEACEIFKTMMEAINYCHKSGIVHRDLKPENLLYLNKTENSPIKVIDFGMSKVVDGKLKERVGTAYYIAPEVLKGDYDEKCDVWSAGVILYTLLCGYPPFNGNDDSEIFQAIEKGKFQFPKEEWDNVSKGAKKLITKILTERSKRPSAEEVLKDEWVIRHAPESSKDTKISIKLVQNYSTQNRLKRAVLTFIATRLNDNDINNLKEAFKKLDKNNDGTLTLAEMKLAAEDCVGFDGVDIENIYKGIDNDNSGKIEYTEFIAAFMDKKNMLDVGALKDAFKAFDLDGSGKIEKGEIEKILGKNNEEIQKIMDKYDLNKDGGIDFGEFIKMMEKA